MMLATNLFSLCARDPKRIALRPLAHTRCGFQYPAGLHPKSQAERSEDFATPWRCGTQDKLGLVIAHASLFIPQSTYPSAQLELFPQNLEKGIAPRENQADGGACLLQPERIP